MQYANRGFVTSRVALALALLAASCAQDAPPYDALPLRDALRAAPEVLAAMPEATRREVAERIEEAARVEEETRALPAPELPTLDALASAADDAREEEGKDALVVAEVAPGEAGLVVASSLPVEPDDANDANDTNDARNEGPPEVRGRPSAATSALEKAALAGRAGRELRALSRKYHAREIVRTTGLPMGVWLWRETLYVNASWLVALSALEQVKAEVVTDSPISPNYGSRASDGPTSRPLSVDDNPYHLPDNVEQCALQVQGTCACATNLSCGHAATDPTFADANAECTWVNADPTHAAALCVLALMSIDGVRACVESAGAACAALPVTTREDALAFVASPACMSILNQCLDTGEPFPPPAAQSCSGCGGGCGSCDSCNSDCSKCNDNCSKCNDNCSECNQNNKDCNDNCKSCKSSGAQATAAQAGPCSVRPRENEGRSPLPSPVGTALWLVAPVIYVLSRKRRSK